MKVRNRIRSAPVLTMYWSIIDADLCCKIVLKTARFSSRTRPYDTCWLLLGHSTRLQWFETEREEPASILLTLSYSWQCLIKFKRCLWRWSFQFWKQCNIFRIEKASTKTSPQSFRLPSHFFNGRLEKTDRPLKLIRTNMHIGRFTHFPHDVLYDHLILQFSSITKGFHCSDARCVNCENWNTNWSFLNSLQ